MNANRILAAIAAAGSLTGATITADAFVTAANAGTGSEPGPSILECPSIPSTADPNVLRTVYAVGRGLGVSDKVMLAGFEAGWVESRMNNLPCGDSDSLGVFQQRPSQGWGTPAQVMNVSFASNSFFTRAITVAANNPGYTAGQVAQAVQRSAFPSRYDQAEATARALIEQARQLQPPEPPRHGKSTVGWYRSSDASFHLTNEHANGASDYAYVLGAPNMIPLTGDWDGNGTTTTGWYRPSDASFHLRNSHGNGPSDHAFVFGPPNMVPVTGDWNGDGKTTVGWYRGSDASFHLRNRLSNGATDHAFVFGATNMTPVTGDWNGDGVTTVGWYRGSDASFHLTDKTNGGATDHAFVFGPPNMKPVTGDWNADGKTTIGWYRGSDASFHLTNNHNNGPSDHAFVFGAPNMTPVTGDWNNA